MAMTVGMVAIFFIFAAVVVLVIGLIRPTTFSRKSGNVPTRNKILKIGTLFIFGGVVVLVFAAALNGGGQVAVVAGQGPVTESSAGSLDKAIPTGQPHRAIESSQAAVDDSRKMHEIDSVECKKDSKCAFEKYDLKASLECQMAVKRHAEDIAKFQVKFDDTMFAHPFFDKSGFKDGQEKGTHSLIYSGNQALFQNGLGAWQRARYYCAYNLDQKKTGQISFDRP
jgi:hypothetical protein